MRETDGRRAQSRKRRDDLLCLDVRLDLVKAPLDQRVDLDQPCPINLNDRQGSAFGPL